MEDYQRDTIGAYVKFCMVEERLKELLLFPNPIITDVVIHYLRKPLWEMNQDSLCYTPLLVYDSWKSFMEHCPEGHLILHFCWVREHNGTYSSKANRVPKGVDYKLHIIALLSQMPRCIGVRVTHEEHSAIYDYIAEHEYEPSLKYWLDIS